ncbi:peptidoglycan-N-acetylglucosamine deacetylase [Andreesenia angusta]|uniref:Peptidoglycan-N-acetylglucosamine deacetylase n=1 Tax=Andreesenia angusta TaxID=39480 RepID=A0A1S1V5G1_9FIRM|nr:polysaccharide deacetylase family protein [Andreesenia angusta]OHW61812.1 peptidoglycan-N-acetylglucosamine deacetylase [Andreesenia angusta]
MKKNRKMLGIILLVFVIFAVGIGMGNILGPSGKGEIADAETSEASKESVSKAEGEEIGLEQLESREGVTVHNMKIGYESELYPEEICQIEDGSGELYIGAQDLAKVIGAELQWNGISKQLIIKNEQDYIVVDTRENVIVDSDGNEEQVKLYGKGKKSILPSGRVMSYFGYQISRLGELGIFRIKNPDSELLDIEFSKKYEAEFGKQIADYEFKYRHERAMFEEQYPDKRKALVMKEIPDEKVAYLTFDDGPNEFTPQILDILNSYDIKATFFVLGKNIYGKEDILSKTYQEGHSIGLHSMNHVYREVYASPSNFVSQMDQCNELVKSAIGVKTRLIRPPYGSKPQLTEDFRNAAVESGYRVWDWNIDSGDAVGNRGSAGVYNYTANQASRFEGPVIILFHDKANTTQALPNIIEYLSGRGYRFEAITDDLMPFNFWGDKRYVN